MRKKVSGFLTFQNRQQHSACCRKPKFNISQLNVIFSEKKILIFIRSQDNEELQKHKMEETAKTKIDTFSTELNYLPKL